MRPFVVSGLVLGVVLAWGASADAAQAPAKPAAREGIEALEAQLDRAVDRVSLPHAARLLGRAESARGYRLPGYGVVLVLTPRALPGASGQVYFVGRGPKHRVHVQPAPGSATAVVMEGEDEGVEVFERQVLVLQHETEAARRAAEEEMERIVRDARVRVAPPAPPAATPATPTPPQSPPPPEAPALEPPHPAPQAPAAPAPAAAPLPVVAPEAPLPPGEPGPPPWATWFGVGTPAETRTPEAVIADVRASLVESLLAPGAAPAGLAGDERVTVAVDFVPGGLFAANARPARTLVVSVRVRDVAARAKGAIGADELRRRVEVHEY